MNSFPLEQQHAEQAKDLYVLRSRLLARDMTGSGSVLDLERRLAVHLGILARLETVDFSPVGKEAERFLYFATHLQSGDREMLFET